MIQHHGSELISQLEQADDETVRGYTANTLRACTGLDAEALREALPALGKPTPVWLRAIQSAARRMWCRRHIHISTNVDASRSMEKNASPRVFPLKFFTGNPAGVELLYNSKVSDCDLRPKNAQAAKTFSSEVLEKAPLWDKAEYHALRKLLATPLTTPKKGRVSEGIETVPLSKFEVCVGGLQVFSKMNFDLYFGFGVPIHS
jgi:hypothetical protein